MQDDRRDLRAQSYAHRRTWVESSESGSIDVVNPATEDLLAAVPGAPPLMSIAPLSRRSVPSTNGDLRNALRDVAGRSDRAQKAVVELRIVAYSLGYSGSGWERISSELAQRKWGGILVSANRVWRLLRRHGLNTRTRRLALIAGYAAPYEPPRAPLQSRTSWSSGRASWSASTAEERSSLQRKHAGIRQGCGGRASTRPGSDLWAGSDDICGCPALGGDVQAVGEAGYQLVKLDEPRVGIAGTRATPRWSQRGGTQTGARVAAVATPGCTTSRPAVAGR